MERNTVLKAVVRYPSCRYCDHNGMQCELPDCFMQAQGGLGIRGSYWKSDEEFQKTIKLIDSKILDLANRIKVDFITQSVV